MRRSNVTRRGIEPIAMCHRYVLRWHVVFMEGVREHDRNVFRVWWSDAPGERVRVEEPAAYLAAVGAGVLLLRGLAA